MRHLTFILFTLALLASASFSCSDGPRTANANTSDVTNTSPDLSRESLASTAPNWSTRTFVFKNMRQDDIWVGAQNIPNSGWFIPAGDSTTISVDGDAASIAIWAGVGCDSNGNNCLSGGKNAPEPPVSVIEFTLHSTGSQVDFFDLSFVSGWNAGIGVEPFGPGVNCDSWGCASPIDTTTVPPELIKRNDQGKIVGVFSICKALSDVDQVSAFTHLQNIQTDKELVCCDCGCGAGCNCDNPNSKFCCSPFASSLPQNHGGICDETTWPKASTGVDYPSVFKNYCSAAYSWPFDDLTSTLRCRSNYRLLFF